MVTEVRVPDIGTPNKVPVIEILVKVGDKVSKDTGLLTLETDKATMEIPCPVAGVIKTLKVKIGDKVGQNDLLFELEAMGATSSLATKKEEIKVASLPTEAVAQSSKTPEIKNAIKVEAPSSAGSDVYAGPGVRRFARELGVDLQVVESTGPKGRVQKSDVEEFVRDHLENGPSVGSGSLGNLSPAPVIDFNKFGETETKALSRIKKLSGANLHRNWVSIPHVTHFEEANITELEAFRKEQQIALEKSGLKFTLLGFLIKALVSSLKAYPNFNSSLDASGTELILKKYFHVGIAVDTPNGLVVPVIRDVDKKGLIDLAEELGKVSTKARNGLLTALDMQGGCFTISSLGGIGGTSFTPIINAPEVAILGVSKAQIRLIMANMQSEAIPQLMLPLSLSYDHRVIDGAEAARFMSFFAKQLSDVRRLLL